MNEPNKDMSARYVDQFIQVLKSYYDNRQDTSGNNLFVYGHRTAIDGISSNQIDCSAYVILGLMGVPFVQSPYASLVSSHWNPLNTLKRKMYTAMDRSLVYTASNPISVGDYPWAIDVKQFKRKIVKRVAPIRTASQLCEWMEDSGYAIDPVPDFRNVQRGDIIFYAKMENGAYRQPNRYKKISHVSVVASVLENKNDTYEIGAQYPYKHTMYEVSTFGGIVLNTALEKRTPEYIVAICRPPFAQAK